MNLLNAEGGVIASGQAISFDEAMSGWMVDDVLYLDADRQYSIEPPPKKNVYVEALEEMYDAKAQERSYDNRITCALRAGYAGPFQAEGAAFGTWMDTCNANAYNVMAAVLAGEIEQPTIPELLAMMPEFSWPA